MIRHVRNKVLTAAWAIALLALAANALARTDPGPEAAVRSYFDDVASRGLISITDHMHPAEIIRFRDLFSPVFEMTTDDDDVFVELFASRPREDVIAMSAESFMRALFGSLQDKIGPGLTFAQPDILGTVMEGDIAHVLTRVYVGMEEVGISQMQVVSLRQHDGVWKMMLTGEITGMGEAIRNQITRQRQAETSD